MSGKTRSSSYRPHRYDTARTSVWIEVIVRDKDGNVKYVAHG